MFAGSDQRPVGTLEANGDKLLLAIIADDLTGACDAGVAFIGLGSAVRTELTHIPASRSGIWAVSTGTRDIEPRAARVKVRSALMEAAQDPARHIFKKVDSVLRGNSLEEIHQTIETARFDLAVLCPAHPGLSRSMVNGRLIVQDGYGDSSIPVAEPLARFGCESARIGSDLTIGAAVEKMRAALADGVKVMLCDAVNSEDLKTAVRAARSLVRKPLWIGSGGLARALAEEFGCLQKEELVERKGSVVFFVGSNHAATLAQQEHLQTTCDVSLELDSSRNCHRMVHVAYQQTQEKIREMVRGVLPGETGCLFMTGGDTALSVCHALGVRALRLLREITPGVPMALIEGGAFDGIPVVLKSGAFGAKTLMQDVLEMFQRKEVLA